MKTFLTIFFSFVIGIGLGILLNNIGVLNLQNEVRVGELANFLVAIFLGISLPISIHKWLGDNRKLKDLTIERASSYLDYLEDISNMFISWIILDEISDKNKKEMNFRIRLLRSKTDGLISEIKNLNSNTERDYSTELTNLVNGYWQVITGGDIMNADFKLTADFMNTETTERQRIQNKVMELIFDLNKK